MITDEFTHYFRLELSKELSGREIIHFFAAVKDIVSGKLTSESINISHRMNGAKHLYEVGLSENITQEQAKTIFDNLKGIFLVDDLEYSIS
jgi:hypothetical protein